MLRNKKGKFRQSYLDRYYGIILLIETVSLGLVLHRIGEPVQFPISPKAPPMVIKQVFASESVTEPPSDIKGYITYKFGKYAERAIKIAECESSLVPDKIGDKDLITYNGNEIVGDSVGLFQIRTGGKGWNRAKENGLTADEFREKLKDVKYNVDYAYKLFIKQGFTPWTCDKWVN